MTFAIYIIVNICVYTSIVHKIIKYYIIVSPSGKPHKYKTIGYIIPIENNYYRQYVWSDSIHKHTQTGTFLNIVSDDYYSNTYLYLLNFFFSCKIVECRRFGTEPIEDAYYIFCTENVSFAGLLSISIRRNCRKLNVKIIN